ncbi:MAG: hypothetical protein QG626_490 [Patescibacteria group bacterium]|nr:hypothetical protein [Patescibacteria group bacterium]
MTQFIIGLFLASTSFAQDGSNTLHVPAGARLEADGTVTPASQVEAENEIAAKQAATDDRIRMMEARTVADPTTNGSVLGRPAVTADNVCGFAMDQEAFSGRRMARLAEQYPDCVRAQAEFVDAQGRATNTELALRLGRDFHSEADESATGNAAAMSAITDDEGGTLNFGGMNGIAGLPYGQSVVGQFQNNVGNLQGLMAMQMGVTNNVPSAPTKPATPAPSGTKPAASPEDAAWNETVGH